MAAPRARLLLAGGILAAALAGGCSSDSPPRLPAESSTSTSPAPDRAPASTQTAGSIESGADRAPWCSSREAAVRAALGAYEAAASNQDVDALGDRSASWLDALVGASPYPAEAVAAARGVAADLRLIDQALSAGDHDALDAITADGFVPDSQARREALRGTLDTLCPPDAPPPESP